MPGQRAEDLPKYFETLAAPAAHHQRAMADQPAGPRRFHQRSAADLCRAPCIEDEAEVHAAFWYKRCRQQGLAERLLQAGKEPLLTDDIAQCVGVYATCQGVQRCSAAAWSMASATSICSTSLPAVTSSSRKPLEI